LALRIGSAGLLYEAVRGAVGAGGLRAAVFRDGGLGLSGAGLQPGSGVQRLAAVFGRFASVDAQQSTQNWHGPGESDCIIKTKHCDGRNGC
jgi:hypothetical protein